LEVGVNDWTTGLAAVLERLGAEGGTATYAAVAERLAVPPPHRIHRLTDALEALVRADHVAGRPLRAAVVVSRARDGLPAPGFFHLCRELGRYFGPDDGPQAALFHQIELDRLRASLTGQPTGPDR
jgi:hypothetical protein